VHYEGPRDGWPGFGDVNSSRESTGMTQENHARGCVLMVHLDHEQKELGDVGRALEPLGIPFEVLESGRQLRWAPTLVLRVPPDRLEEAILALELKGFPHVLAYQSERTV
jgi:hypothetical protein